jgi:RNA polymerase sigma-70 factor (ECF subfamily)
MYCNDKVCREDLFQEILLQLWKSFPHYDRKRKFTTWMYRIALNTAISQFRKESANKMEYTEILPETMVDNYRIAYEKLEEFKMLHLAIAKLSKAEKAITILYMDDYPYDEIAEIVGISVSNVGVKINRIKKKLKKYLNDAGYGL